MMEGSALASTLKPGALDTLSHPTDEARATHWLHLEQPERINSEIVGFLGARVMRSSEVSCAMR